MRVGLAIHRRRSDADFQALAMQAGELILAGIRLQMAGQPQRVVLPAIEPGHSPRMKRDGRPNMPATCRSMICTTLMARKTRIGERSRPPIGGSRLRNGASTGAASCPTSTTGGVEPPRATPQRTMPGQHAKYRMVATLATQ